MAQKRILFFVHEGSGLGHLRRMSRIAEEMQGRCATLVVSGLREAAWIVPDKCEFLHLPSWNSIKPKRAAYWNRPTWLEVTSAGAVEMRQKFLQAVFEAYTPDAVLVDYLPFGRHNELGPALSSFAGKKYFILRGLIDTSDRELQGDAMSIVGATFDRLLVTADVKVVDVVKEYRFDPLTTSKVIYVGYVAPGRVDRQSVRRTRGIGSGTSWVVCSAGGGMYAEEFLSHCITAAATLPDVCFDVVFGPLSNKDLGNCDERPPNCRVESECSTLPQLHASCDVLVTTGGYNTLLEGVTGGARMIVHPNRTGEDDEQANNTTRLSAHYPVRLLPNANDLESELRNEIALANKLPRPKVSLDINGASRIREIVFNDLGIATSLS